METDVKDKNIDKIPKENLREPDGEENNLLFRVFLMVFPYTL